MKNAILEICERLRGFRDDVEYFEVTRVARTEDGNYSVIVRVVKSEEEDESNK
ncbi:hypothetical protein [Treponema pectinovorum]|uniref:hypothetical protein n=1 Tax=Treponema pectinovorum TaxID=164 RepID=UPI00164EA21E|nr:hypothetical protein [Treponema pectinovorum]